MDDDQTTTPPGTQTEEIPAHQLPDVPEESDEPQPEGERYDGGEIPETNNEPVE